ncbi:hypothetical protein Acr_25g0001890 [Actinidia rufa]|uniref:Uncharacterized protein n=1 Tax=Actinidia rufa TaxID=165716 RepID=A0A7J0GY71_9ERIC|nr:hypothetical protein Acr_25g0001890 [Actinidia rufa]
MVAYLNEVKTMSRKIRDFKICQIPREENKKADALAILASAFYFILDKHIPLEFLASPSTEVANPVFQSKGSPTWMDKIFVYLQNGILPQDKLQARRIQYKSARFCILNGILYKRSFSGPLLRCLRPKEMEYVKKEIHEGICENHSRARSLGRKAWNKMQQHIHPQANGQVKVINCTILRNLKARLERSKSEWAEELPSILWAYHTMSRIPMGKTLYSMVFGTEVVILVEIGIPSFKILNFDKGNNETELRLNLDLLDKKRERANYAKQLINARSPNIIIKELRTDLSCPAT